MQISQLTLGLGPFSPELCAITARNLAPNAYHMAGNFLDGWLALAAETRRVDRISSSLGLDSPALQHSPSSLGSSCGSSGLNTPSQNVFRFLPLINDISPELLKTSSIGFVDSLPASLSRGRSNSYSRPMASKQIPRLDTSRHASRRKGSFHTQHESMPSLSGLTLQRPSHPYALGLRNIDVAQRPSLQSTRHVSYPGWPVSKRTSPYTDVATRPLSPTGQEYRKMTGSGPMFISTESSAYEKPPFVSPPLHIEPTKGLTISKPSLLPHLPPSRPARLQTSSTDFDFDYAITDSISPMLSEPFHRLIVKDEEDTMDPFVDGPFPDFQERGPRNPEEETRSVVEEEELRWWDDDPMREFTFDMDLPPLPLNKRQLHSNNS